MSLQSRSCNILIVGATGVGKSSLINYLVGAPVAKVGVGVPVTSRNDVPSYKCTVEGVRLCLFDSWGIEADKTTDWKQRIIKIIDKKGEDGVAWFHTVVYCISAGGQRVQSYDREMIRFFRNEGYSVVIALTKCDQVNDSSIADMRDALPKDVSCVELSSGGRLRSGVSNPFGRETLFAKIVERAIKNLPTRTKKFAMSHIDAWEAEMLDDLQCMDVSRFGNSDIESWIKTSAIEFSEHLSRDVSDYVKNERLVLNKLTTSEMLKAYDVAVDVSELKEESTLSFGEGLLLVIALPVVVTFGLLFGEEWAREELQKMIYKASESMREQINRHY